MQKTTAFCVALLATLSSGTLLAVGETAEQVCRAHRMLCPRAFLAALLLWPLFLCAETPDSSVVTKLEAEPVRPAEVAPRTSVFYLTNRRRQADKEVSETYTGERGEPHFGRCEVEFSPIPIVNDVASRVPFYLKSETAAVSLAEQAGPAMFQEQLVAAVEGTSSRSLVLFVHGYNYGFERTCHMAAELQRSLRDKATVVFFSWPSNGLPADYVSDLADVEWSVPLLASLITQLGDQVGASNLRVMAHSLGSRGVIFALQRLAALQDRRPAIDQLVLVAPDFDSATFIDLLPELEPLAKGITLYASSNDTPLKLSQQLNGYPRLGQAGDYLTVVRGLETIDVSLLGRYQFTGHEYFYFHPRVAADLVPLFTSGAGAAERSGLQTKMRNEIRYWEFR